MRHALEEIMLVLVFYNQQSHFQKDIQHIWKSQAWEVLRKNQHGGIASYQNTRRINPESTILYLILIIAKY